jgi:ligand-binding sensor domain-containing protein
MNRLEHIRWRLTISIALILPLILTGCYNETLPPPPETQAPQWVVYRQDSSGLVSDNVFSITIDAAGGKWFGTDQGVSYHLHTGWNTIKYPLAYNISGSLTNLYRVNAVVRGDDGSIWYGTAGGGIKRSNQYADASSFKTFTTPSITSDMIYSLVKDHNGNIWAGTGAGVSRFQPSTTDPTIGTWTKYTSEESPIPDESILSIGLNPTDYSLWFGTYSHGVVFYDGDFGWDIMTPIDQAFPITGMAFQSTNYIWFSTWGDWLYQYSVQTNQWVQFGNDSLHQGGAITDPRMSAIAAGIDGTIWAGTGIGLLRLKGLSWQTFDTSNSSLPSNFIRSLAIDSKQNLWIATPKGVAVYNGNGVDE